MSNLLGIGGGGIGRGDIGAKLDLNVAASGYGHETYCPEGVPVEAALLAILGGFAAAFGVLYTAITMITGAVRRGFKKKSAEEPLAEADKISDAIWMGITS